VCERERERESEGKRERESERERERGRACDSKGIAGKSHHSSHPDLCHV
jgi:hypothetical protein